MASRGGRKAYKSIQSRIKKLPEARPLPIQIQGDKISGEIYQICDRIQNPFLKRIEMSCMALKLSAAASGSYSLSSNQIGITQAAFVIHKDLKDGQWLHPDAYQRQEDTPVFQDGVGVSLEYLLDPEDYDVYMNPRLHAETLEKIYEWEQCLTFPHIRCMVKRPTSCDVSYLNAHGDLVEERLDDFKARVFLHELDHVNGITFQHWRVSEGNMEVMEGKRQENANFMTTVEFYKTKIDELKAEFDQDHPIFKDAREFKDEVDQEGKVWRKLKDEHREDIFKMKDSKFGDQQHEPSFADSMMTDTVRAMRRDRRDALKKRQSKRQHPDDGDFDQYV